MPHANKDVRREYSRKWFRDHRATAANSPLALAIEEIVITYGPISPSAIQELLGYSNRNSIGVALDRLKHAGRVHNVGYGKWVVVGKPNGEG